MAHLLTLRWMWGSCLLVGKGRSARKQTTFYMLFPLLFCVKLIGSLSIRLKQFKNHCWPVMTMQISLKIQANDAARFFA